MLLNAFIGKTTPPTGEELAAELGSAKPLWDQLLDALAGEHQLTEREWKTYSPKAGWSLRIVRKKRNILYLGPAKGCFQAAFILGDKAIAAARESKLSKKALALIDQGTRYPEGTAIRLEVRSARDVAIATALAGIKLAH